MPEIPSDNLYKFVAFSGLFILVFSIVYTNLKLEEFEADKYKLELEIEVQRDSLMTISKNDSIENIILREYHEERGSIQNSQKLKKKMNSIAKSRIASNRQSIEIKHKYELVLYKGKKIVALMNSLCLTIPIGIAFFFCGIYMWYKKIQNPLDNKLAKEAKS